MPAQPAYLTLNRHGTYYFRVVIPLPLRAAFGLQREIRRSLKTDSLRLALPRARKYAARFDVVFDKALHVIGEAGSLSMGALATGSTSFIILAPSSLTAALCIRLPHISVQLWRDARRWHGGTLAGLTAPELIQVAPKGFTALI